ncbi:MAG: glycerophosphodiester phosphodiesterase [Propionibacteriaceae bacterium]|nr:glycerophosphodiester phosphodiesterase [Propionibacteriaceae bacterium]
MEILSILDESAFIPIAHRGGARHSRNIGHENTLEAFKDSAKIGYRFMETDVHATSDGVLVAFHDKNLDRITDGTGAIAQHTYAELSKYNVTSANQQESKRYPIPTLESLLTAFPNCFFNIDLKAEEAVTPLVKVITELGCQSRVLVTSFSMGRLRRFRKLLGSDVAVGAGTAVVAVQKLLFSLGIAARVSDACVLQVPRKHGITVVTPRFVQQAHRCGLKVHVWTVNDTSEMNRLIDIGVDGIITDRVKLLKQVCVERGLWAPPAVSK